jgi:hypothetical protein
LTVEGICGKMPFEVAPVVEGLQSDSDAPLANGGVSAFCGVGLALWPRRPNQDAGSIQRSACSAVEDELFNRATSDEPSAVHREAVQLLAFQQVPHRVWRNSEYPCSLRHGKRELLGLRFDSDYRFSGSPSLLPSGSA